MKFPPRASSRWPRARICRTASRSAPPRIPTPCCSCATARVVELRERSGFSTTQTASDLTIRLGRGSVIVQAAKRRSRPSLCGHRRLPRGRHRHRFQRQRGRQGFARFGDPGRSARLAGQPGQGPASRRSGRDQRQPGAGLGAGRYLLEPQSRPHSRSSSRRCAPALQQIHLPELRYSSTPAGPPARVHRVLRQHSEPGRSIWARRRPCSARRWRRAPNCAPGGPARPSNVEPVLEKLRAASEYLGDEIVVAAFTGADGETQLRRSSSPKCKRDGFAEFLKQQGSAGRLAVEARNGLVAFGPERDAVASVRRQPRLGRRRLPGHAVLCAHRRSLPARRRAAAVRRPLADRQRPPTAGGARYFIAEQKEVDQPDGSPRLAGLRRPAHRHGRLAGRPVAHGLAGLRFARCHPGGRVRGEEPGRHCG